MRDRITLILVLLTLVLSGPSPQLFARATQNHSLEPRQSTTQNAAPRKRALIVGV